uniref:Tryptophan synthase alpha chain n=1 Tax=Pyropia perforata TaxID=182771 RepID=A0A023HRP6_PYRPE|nr:tryptophane synthase alpha subunit [Neoporphyra perforata]AGQ17178.1 tryptophane synthase alpha subunit [Neoporphyra perforata]AHB35160.1 tryptophane synthase alpha subunit [Neoporphyra perforata]AHB35368.1 tryptophane synthase alpha subunit [Neoporphyra perforata]AIA19531.1 tryptophane synthase alpha subunit [Neoporphyra perforata]AIA19740.1 tryptophane synthase alpha subunit [Neoporphyra perforata]
MNTIASVFKNLDKQCALIPFITAGDPDLVSTGKALQILDNHGADIIELGLPYSDPLADGPVIQEASSRALKQGINLKEVLQMVKTVQHNIKAPIVLFTYYNPVLNLGINNFIYAISKAGIKGILIPDLPIEESEYIIEVCKSFNIELILLLAPTSSYDRINKIVSNAPSCIYLVSTTGVTGQKFQITSKLRKLTDTIRKMTNKSIILGFGISSIEQIQEIKSWNVNGIVIGSAFVKRLSGNLPKTGLEEIQSFCKDAKNAIIS